MIRQLSFTVTSLAVLAAATNSAEARNFFNRQAEPLPTPSAPSQPGWFAPTQKMRYQAVQKMPYQATQKGVYQKGVVATNVHYVHHRPHRKTCCGYGASYQTVLTVIDPKTCCPVDVPVCLPACCTGQPHCRGHRGLLGRGVAVCTWGCGYTVRIIVGHHGKVAVHYYGA